MLRMYQFNSARQIKDYYTAALESGDYYTNQEQRSFWRGKLAERIGLPEMVQAKDFAALADNMRPRTQEPLTPRTNNDRTVGYDINFHVPKGVSVLHLVTGDERIVDAIRASVHETMLDVERQAKTRVRVGGRDEERSTGELVWGEFVHSTTRPVNGRPDPHLHVHCVVMNATYDHDEQRIKAGQFREIKRDMPMHEAAFYARLAWRLREIGYDVQRRGKQWDVAGISRDITQRYSRRTQSIEELARKLGITSPERKSELGARSRAKKDKNFTPGELHQEWISRLSEAERRAIGELGQKQTQSRASREHAAVKSVEHANARQLVDRAITHCTERASVMSESRLLETALRFGIGEVRPDAVREAASSHPELLRRREGDVVLVTSRQALAEEEAMLGFARDGRGTCVPMQGQEAWQPRDGSLNRQQRGAVDHLLASRDRVMLLRGGAGTGKSTLLREAAQAMRSRGFAITMLAPTGDASRGVLRKAGFADADTVAKFLDDPAMQAKARGGVVWVDEAGLMGTPSMRRLFDVAKKVNARVVLSGDAKQHKPVERGDAMRLLESQAELPVAELTRVVRQTGTYRDAVEAISKGRFDQGVMLLDQIGAIKERSGKDWTELVVDFVEKRRQGRSTLAIAPTHAVGDQLSSLIRSGLQREGLLSQDERLVPQLKDAGWSTEERADATRYEVGHVVQFHRAVAASKANARGKFQLGERWNVVSAADEQGRVTVEHADGRRQFLPVDRAKSFTVAREDLLRVAAGEQVRITGNGKTVDGKHRLNTGGVHRIKGFTREGHMTLDNGWVVPQDFGRMQHAYVSTSHAAQGRTVDWVYIAQSAEAGGAASAEQVYVSVSRGRHGVTMYVDDRTSLLDAVRRTSERRGATELFGGRTDGSMRSRQHAMMMRRLEAYEVARTRDAGRRQEQARTQSRASAQSQERGRGHER